MHEPFVIPVICRGTEHEFKARFERWGYSHRIAVLVGDDTLAFEPDEEGGYRALARPEHPASLPVIDSNLLEAIAKKLADLNE